MEVHVNGNDLRRWEALGNHWERCVLQAQADPAARPEGPRIAIAGKGDAAYAFRPDEVLVRGEPGAIKELDPELHKEGLDGSDNRLIHLGVSRYRIADRPPGEDPVTRLRRQVDRLRSPVIEAAGLRVSPNHVFGGFQIRWWFPATPPIPAPMPDDLPELGSGAGAGVVVGVLDTGIFPPDDAPPSPGWLTGHYVDTPADRDEDDLDGDNLLDFEAGHGTFIVGQILMRAPGATVFVAKALDPHGITDDHLAATALHDLVQAAHGQETPLDIVNLSFGGFTEDDQSPLGLGAVIGRLTANGVAVIAAAGNCKSERPVWPAAENDVIGVAALVDDAPGAAQAVWTSYGKWVDACCAGADRESAFIEFQGGLDGVNVQAVPPGLASNYAAANTQWDFRRWARWSGTSFAAPRLAARLAVELEQARPTNRSPLHVAKDLLKNGMDRSPQGLGIQFDP
jgi:hypothetical protein